MAKVNPVKLKQDADKLEKAGRLDQAIVLYRQVVEDNPRDWNTINKIGDLYAKVNKPREASQEYAKVADFYAKDGFLLKAIAIWKKINKLDASALEPYLNLAELYAKQGLMMEAKGQYQIVVDEHIKRGKTREAGEVLRKMADIDPGDLKIRSKLADLYTREGSPEKAVEEHIAIAEELNKKGHLAEALQVLEKGLKLDPQSSRLRVELARVHMVQRNYDRAGHYLEEAVRHSPRDPQILARLGEAYLGGRRIKEAEDIFRRLLEINPADEESRIQMGRVHLLRDSFDQAYEQFQPAVDRMLGQREGERAASLLQQVIQKNPSHVPTLVKLVEVYRALQKETAILATLSQLTEAYIQQGQFGQAASTLQFLVAREPQNQQHKTKLEFVRSRLPPGRPVAPPPAGLSLGVERLEEEFELEPAEPAVAAPSPRPAGSAPASRPAAAAPPRAPIPASGPLNEEDREFIEEHIAEGKVFRKYGLVDKAVDQFESVVARFPDMVEARQELRDLYKEKGQPARAAEQCLALAEIFRLKGDDAAAESQEAEARGLAPAPAPAARPQAAAPAPAPPAARPQAAPPVPPPLTPVPLEEEAAPELALSADEEIPLEVEEAGIEPPSAEAVVPLVGETAFSLDEEGSEEELPVQFIDEEPEAALAEPGEEEEALLLEPEAPAPTAVPRAPSAPPDLERVLEEVEQYVSLGFVDDAKDALQEIEARYAGHPALMAKLAELGLEEGGAAQPAKEPLGRPVLASEEGPLEQEEAPEAVAADVEGAGSAEEEELWAPEAEAEALVGEPHALLAEAGRAGGFGGGSFAEPEAGGLDLGGELDELFGAQAAVEEAAKPASAALDDSGLADIFKEFKKGVDKQLGQEDYDTRYNLGIAYKEMGLVDEAIAEFQLAAKDEGRLLECSSMLGICFLEKGMPKLAVKWFEKGLKVPGRAEEEYQGLRYDLAMAHEAAGERERALSLFTDLYGQNANFRDVAAKVRELRGN